MGGRALSQVQVSGVEYYVDFIGFFLIIGDLIALFFILIFLQRESTVLFQQVLLTLLLLIIGLFGMVMLRVKIRYNEVLPASSFVALFLLGFPYLLFSAYYVLSAEKLTFDLISMFFYGAVAIAEECFFRGFLLTLFKRMMKTITGNSIIASIIALFSSAVFFTIYHGYVYGTMITTQLFVLIAGIIFGVLYLASRNLTPSILIHAIWNIAMVISSGLVVQIV